VGCQRKQAQDQLDQDERTDAAKSQRGRGKKKPATLHRPSVSGWKTLADWAPEPLRKT
jgi:hypothetical protein